MRNPFVNKLVFEVAIFLHTLRQVLEWLQILKPIVWQLPTTSGLKVLL